MLANDSETFDLVTETPVLKDLSSTSEIEILDRTEDQETYSITEAAIRLAQMMNPDCRPDFVMDNIKGWETLLCLLANKEPHDPVTAIEIHSVLNDIKTMARSNYIFGRNHIKRFFENHGRTVSDIQSDDIYPIIQALQFAYEG